jgi:serine phosphatase RsbU (regulator of sigma subunit)/anti-sigma regulatory factor (Ser/Thr protein kinase)/anti-anti-sigma regulatory factor
MLRAMIEPGGTPHPPAPPPATGGTPAAQLPAAGPPEAVRDCFDAVPAMLWSLEGPQLRVTAANAGARASVDDRPDLLGTPFRDVLPAPDARQVLAVLEAAFASGEPAAVEQRRGPADGDRDEPAEPVESVHTWTVLPTFHGDGSMRGLAVHVVDTTAQSRARLAAEEAAAAAERRYVEVQAVAHDAALELRRTLLPSGVPVLSRLRMAAQFRVAAHAPDAGGDWFDALPLGDGRVALLVGEVSGHGTRAAAAMGQLRAVAVEAVAAGEEPESVLGRLDRFAATTRATRAATLCLAVLDPATGELTIGSHAHPAPLVVAADGSTRFLPVEPAWPLGTSGPKAPLLHDRIAQGEQILLYTDGLVERTGRRLQDTMGALARVATAAVRNAAGTAPGALADRTAAVVLDRLAYLESVRAGCGYRDDVTLLVAHLRPPLAPLRLRIAAGPGALALIREQLGAWLDGAGVTVADAESVLHAAGEAAANVVEHAYAPGADAWVEVAAQLTRASEVRVSVRDGGTWRDPATGAAGRGRGMLLMREQVDDVGVQSSAEGTTVTLTHRVERPALAGPVAPVAATPTDLTVAVADGQVQVAGPVDLATAARLRTALQAAPQAAPESGAARLVVDLTGVTQLSAAGVHVLHELAVQAPDLCLVAPPGSQARRVLLLTGLGRSVGAP